MAPLLAGISDLTPKKGRQKNIMPEKIDSTPTDKTYKKRKLNTQNQSTNPIKTIGKAMTKIPMIK